MIINISFLEPIISGWVYYILILSGIIITFIGATISYNEKKEENRTKNNLNNKRNFQNYLWIIIGLIISLLAGVYTTYNQEYDKIQTTIEANANKKTSDSLNSALSLKQNDLISKQSDLIDKQNELSKSQDRLLNKQDELNKANNKLADVSSKTYKNLVGFDSKPDISVTAQKDLLDKDLFDIKFWVSNYYDYPIEDVKISLYDSYFYILKIYSQDTTPKSSRMTLKYSTDDYNNFKKEFNFPSITSHRKYIPIYETKLPKALFKANYTLTVEWRYGYYEMVINCLPSTDSTRLIVNNISIITPDQKLHEPDDFFKQPSVFNHIHDKNFDRSKFDLKGNRIR